MSQVNINSVKQTINMHKTMGWFGIFMAFFSLHLSRQEATLCVTSIQGPRVVLTPESWTVKHEAYRSDSDIQL
ncbi:hypothetical protein JX639_24490, partial [Escherichia coli]|nr:hypothetical protein [Escherichia coli]